MNAMDFTRRSFLEAAAAEVKRLKIARTVETRPIRPYSSVSCGVIVHARGDWKNTRKDIIHVEGEPDHPVNQGTLCPKGASFKDYVANDPRLSRVLHRARGALEWQPMSWDEPIDRIARRLKATRDADFIAKEAASSSTTHPEKPPDA